MLTLLSLLFSMQLSWGHDHPSTHGMVIFGREKIYLSHLPMFHSPHDYQVVVEAEIDPKSLKTYQQVYQPQMLFTIMPEPFVLPDMIQKPRPFKVRIFKGHFERGGVPVADAMIKITKVIYFKKFIPGEMKPPKPEYFFFGGPSEWYGIHKIVSKPDFDHILAVKPGPKPIPLFTIYQETGDLSM